LTKEQLEKLEEVKKIQGEITTLNEKFDDEFLELEIKYEKLRQPHLDERKKNNKF